MAPMGAQLEPCQGWALRGQGTSWAPGGTCGRTMALYGLGTQWIPYETHHELHISPGMGQLGGQKIVYTSRFVRVILAQGPC